MIYCETFQELLGAVKANEAIALQATAFKIEKYEVKILAEALKSNTSLLVLNLGKNQITDAGAQYLLETFKINSFLQVLNLKNNSSYLVFQQAIVNNDHDKVSQLLNDNSYITEVGAGYLAEALKSNTSLQALSLTSNNYTNNISDIVEQGAIIGTQNNNFTDTGWQIMPAAQSNNIASRSNNINDKIKPETLIEIKLKTASNKYLYINTKSFINKLFDKYEKLNADEKIDLFRELWLTKTEANKDQNINYNNNSSSIFKPSAKIKFLEIFCKHPNPAQFISKESQLALDNFTEIFQDFTNSIKNNYITNYFYFNRVCKSFKGGDDSVAEQSAPKVTDSNNNNSQSEQESNENLYNIFPLEILYKIIELVIFGGGINHSAPAMQGDSQVKPADSQVKPTVSEGNLADSMNNAGDAMDASGEGD